MEFVFEINKPQVKKSILKSISEKKNVEWKFQSKVSVLIKIVGSSCVYNYSFESFET